MGEYYCSDCGQPKEANEPDCGKRSPVIRALEAENDALKAENERLAQLHVSEDGRLCCVNPDEYRRLTDSASNEDRLLHENAALKDRVAELEDLLSCDECELLFCDKHFEVYEPVLKKMEEKELIRIAKKEAP